MHLSLNAFENAFLNAFENAFKLNAFKLKFINTNAFKLKCI